MKKGLAIKLYFLINIISLTIQFPKLKLEGRNLKSSAEEKCQELTETRNYLSGIENCEIAVSQNPSKIESFLNLSKNYLKLKKNQKALVQIKKALKINPENSQIYILYAELMENLNYEEEALSYFNKAVFKSEKNLDTTHLLKNYSQMKNQEKEDLIIDIALLKKNDSRKKNFKNDLCLMLFKSQDYEEARKVCEEVLKIDPNNSKILFARSMSYYYLEEDQSMKDIIFGDMIKAYDLDKTNVEILNNLGTFFYFEEDLEKALGFYDEVLKIDGLMIRAIYNKAYVLLELERFEESLEAWEQYEDLVLTDTNSFYLKGFVLEKLGRLDEAINSYDNSLRIYPENFNSLINKAYVLLKKGELEKGRKLYKNIIDLEDLGFYDFFRKGPILKIDSRYKGNFKCYSRSALFDKSVLEDYIKLSDELRNTGKVELAIKCLDLLKKEDENNSIVWKKMGDSLLLESNYNRAEKNYDRALALNPEFVEAYLAKGVLYQKQGEAGKGQLYFQKGLEVDPNNFKALNNLGYLQEVGGNLDKAIELYEKSLAQKTSDGIALVNLGNAYLKKKKNIKAIEILKKALKNQKQKKNSLIYKNISEAYKNLDDYKNAFKYLNLGLSQTDIDISLLNSKAVLFQELKLYEVALGIFETIIKLDPNYPPAYNSIGVIYQTMGDKKQAHLYYNEAIKIDPYFALSFNNKGYLFYNDKMYKEAAFFLDKAIDIDPDYSTAYNNRGLVFFKTKDYENAVKFFKKAVQLNKGNKSAKKNLAFALKRVRK